MTSCNTIPAGSLVAGQRIHVRIEGVQEMTWIQTLSGKKFDYIEPDPSTVRLEDIAHALSYVNRFVGHSLQPYSVANHCLQCSEVARSPDAQLWALMHDATEAYIGDIPAPLKALLPNAQIIEERVEKAILQAMGWEPSDEVRQEVHAIDKRMLMTEKSAFLMEGPEWGCKAEPYYCLSLVHNSPEAARKQFVVRYRRLAAAVGANPDL